MQLSEIELIQLIENNLKEYAIYRANSPMIRLHDQGDLAWVTSSNDVPFANQVFHCQIPDAQVDNRIDEIISSFQGHEVSMSWLLGPSSKPDDLGDRLIERGLLYQGSTPGMAIELAQLADSEISDSLEIIKVSSQELMNLALPILSEAYNMPEYYSRFLIDLYSSLGFDQERWSYYLALLDGEPVGTSCLFYGAGVAGIYSVATISSMRKKGIGTALTLRPLNDARSAGYEIGVLRSSEIAAKLYQELGYREVCSFSDYVRIK